MKNYDVFLKFMTFNEYYYYFLYAHAIDKMNESIDDFFERDMFNVRCAENLEKKFFSGA